MNKFYFLSFFLLSLSLTACDGFTAIFSSSSPVIEESDELTKVEIKNRCIQSRHKFLQGSAEDLYGIKCIEGKKLLIKTQKKGVLIPTTEAGNNLRLEKIGKDDKAKEVEFIPHVINKFYKLGYTVQEDQGDDKEIPFLRKLLPKNERFYGSKGQDYHIVFKTLGNYLVLYKASKDIENIPYTERTSLPKSEEGNYMKSEEGYYMIPFVGYKIKYCFAENKRDMIDNSKTKLDITKCEGIGKKDNPDYIQFQVSEVKRYEYKDKINVLPASYFDGRWFYSEGEVETDKPQAHHYSENAYLVELEKKDNALGLKDVSGEISDLNKTRADLVSVQWKEYKMNKERVNFDQFNEKEDTKSNTKKQRPYVQIDFNLETGEEITDLVITENYFSFVKTYTKRRRRTKEKFSLLRETTLDQKGFLEKKWFKDDQEHRFSVLRVSPQTEKKSGALEEEDQLEYFRLTKFNTNKKDTTIKWHFSNYTVKNGEDNKDGGFYRAIGKEAVEVWNRAFEIITRDYCKDLGKEEDCKTIKVVLAEDEGDKDLGDLRYNILNLVKVKVLSDQKTGTSGWARTLLYKSGYGTNCGNNQQYFHTCHIGYL